MDYNLRYGPTQDSGPILMGGQLFRIEDLMEHVVCGQKSLPPPLPFVPDPLLPGLISKLKEEAPGLAGAALDSKLKECLWECDLDAFVPLLDGVPCFKHPLNENEFLGSIDGIKTDWVQNEGYITDDASVCKIIRIHPRCFTVVVLPA